MKLMVDKDRLELVRTEFEVVQNWGVSGFPAVVYQEKDKAYMLARGFTSLEQLDENLKRIKELV